MKKLLAIVLALVLTVSLFAGCASDNNPQPDPMQLSSEDKTNTSSSDFTIGINFYSITDSLGSAVYDNLNYIADNVDGVKNQWLVISSYDETAQISDCENLISSGVDALIFMPISDNVAGKVADMCEKAGIYNILTMRSISDKDILARLSGYKYFLGWCSEDGASSAYKVFQCAVEDGRTTSGTIFFDENAVLAQVNKGYRKGFDEGKINNVAEYTVAGTTDDLAGTVTNFLTLYPEIDCVFTAMASQGSGEGMLNVLYGDANKNGAKLYCFDSFEGMAEGFEANVLGAVACGQYADAIYSYMIVLNALQGNRLSDGLVQVACNYLILSNSEELELYEKYVDDRSTGFMVYSADDLKDMLVSNNPDFTLEKLQKIASELSMELVKKKVAAFTAG